MSYGNKVLSAHGTHIFHKKCIQTWFQRSTLCPLCKHDCQVENCNEKKK